jgi:hypothetical protein
MTATVESPAPKPYQSENFSLDLRSLALMRIGMGLWILVDLLIRLPDIAKFHSSDSYVPISLLPSPHYMSSHFGLYRYFDTLVSVEALFVVQAVLAIALILGFWTRLTAIVSWWLLVCLQHRTPLLLDGGDIHFKIMMLFSCFLPLGEVWSLDARRKLRDLSTDEERPRFAIQNAVTAGWTLQLCIFYFFAAVLKSDPEWRVQGDALFYTLSIEQFATEFARTLTDYPGLLRFLSFGALFIEFTAPLFFVFPIWNGLSRSIGIFLVLALHSGIALTLHLGLFMPACFVVLLGLIPNWLWESILQRRAFWDDFQAREQPRPWPISGALSLFLVAFSLVQNCAVWPALNFKLPPASVQPVLGIGRAFSILQYWGLFAPRPFKEDGWFAAAGVLKSGETVNLLDFDRPYPPERPLLLSTQYKNQRWRRYFQNMWERGNPNWATRFLEKRGQEWNQLQGHQHPNDPIDKSYLIFIQEYSQPPGVPPKISQYRIGQFPDDHKSVELPVCPKCGKAHAEHKSIEFSVTQD